LLRVVSREVFGVEPRAGTGTGSTVDVVRQADAADRCLDELSSREARYGFLMRWAWRLGGSGMGDNLGGEVRLAAS